MADFPSLLPGNASQMQRDIEQVIAGFIADVPVQFIKNAHNPKLCRADFLPWLAWEWSVDEWDGEWPVETQRNAIWASPTVHRFKGTPHAIKEALVAVGYGSATLIEGMAAIIFDGGTLFDGTEDYGDPDHWAEYRVYLERPITIDQADQVKRILRNTAAGRSRLKGLYFTQAANRYNATISFDGGFTHGVV